MSFHSGVSLRLMFVVAVGVVAGMSASAEPRGGQEAAPPPKSFTATSIPGVVAAGTKIELVATGLGRTEGPVAMQDGSMLVSSANRILKVDLSDTVSTFVADSNETNGMGWDQRGVSSRCSAGKETKRSACCILPHR